MTRDGALWMKFLIKGVAMLREQACMNLVSSWYTRRDDKSLVVNSALWREAVLHRLKSENDITKNQTRIRDLWVFKVDTMRDDAAKRNG